MNDYATNIVFLLALVATALLSGLAGLLMDRLHPQPQPFLLRSGRGSERDEDTARYLVDVGDSA